MFKQAFFSLCLSIIREQPQEQETVKRCGQQLWAHQDHWQCWKQRDLQACGWSARAVPQLEHTGHEEDHEGRSHWAPRHDGWQDTAFCLCGHSSSLRPFSSSLKPCFTSSTFCHEPISFVPGCVWLATSVSRRRWKVLHKFGVWILHKWGRAGSSPQVNTDCKGLGTEQKDVATLKRDNKTWV